MLGTHEQGEAQITWKAGLRELAHLLPVKRELHLLEQRVSVLAALQNQKRKFKASTHSTH